jgi:hypothetical protein
MCILIDCRVRPATRCILEVLQSDSERTLETIQTSVCLSGFAPCYAWCSAFGTELHVDLAASTQCRLLAVLGRQQAAVRHQYSR